MTANEFQFKCEEVGVLPELALEHDFVRQVLKDDISKKSITNQLKLSTYLHEQF